MTTRTGLPPTLGLLLAGGASTRMGGGDKALRDVGGRTLLDRVIVQLAPQCESLVLSSNDDPSRWKFFDLPVIADGIAGRQGPLAGISAGLDWVGVHRPHIAWVVSVSTDCPFLPVDLVARLHEARRAAHAPLAVAASGGRIHPVVALWQVSLRDDLREALDQGLRKAGAFVARYDYATAQWPAAPYDPFFNVNTPDDLAEAARLASLVDRA